MAAEEALIEPPESGVFDLIVLGTGLVESLIAGHVTQARCRLCGER